MPDYPCLKSEKSKSYKGPGCRDHSCHTTNTQLFIHIQQSLDVNCSQVTRGVRNICVPDSSAAVFLGVFFACKNLWIRCRVGEAAQKVRKYNNFISIYTNILLLRGTHVTPQCMYSFPQLESAFFYLLVVKAKGTNEPRT